MLDGVSRRDSVLYTFFGHVDSGTESRGSPLFFSMCSPQHGRAQLDDTYQIAAPSLLP